ncbi:uncharacterized protein LOC109837488 isoform X2 [Asparagus officinalis]|uniref:uncharacterized protein LOC109837488 isoform X2 n=1 Tax=Asparagus officinalis TaxID=4686 RepID=UPI00098E00E8|nr:uncharacterized protein LOC109837488 isoform X2 [Asparagus officinalis]
MNHPLSLLHNPSSQSLQPQPLCYHSKSVRRLNFGRKLHFAEKCWVQREEKNCDSSDNLRLHVQTLRKFPIEKLSGEVAIVRLDSSLLLEQLGINSLFLNGALSTIRYLHTAGAKVLLISNWGNSSDSNLLSTESFADHLSKLLNIEVVPANIVSDLMQSTEEKIKKSDVLLLPNLSKFREELTNCTDFSRKLSSGAYVFVNDAFSLSHKILASTVGISRFCDASVAGFHFEEKLLQLIEARKITRQPYFAIIGGGNFLEKAPALHLLASTCDGLIFIGKLAFQTMHALGVSVPSCLIEQDAAGEALKLIQIAHNRRIPIYYPDDLWCADNHNPESLQLFRSDGIMAGWTPLYLGPVSLEKIFALLSKCKVLWIGPLKFDPSVEDADGESKLALMLESINKAGCEVTVVGNAACKAIFRHSSTISTYKIFKSASVLWDFLKGRTLPGVTALDRDYPFHLDWDAIFTDPTKPLVVDIGSGNGLFLFNMAKRWKHSNFLGLEINDKLVKRCQQRIHGVLNNVYFLSTNATSSFHSIISSYPGALVLTSIHCPNPDFNKEEHRWRMVQRIMVEAVIDLLVTNGKIFLQSDIEAVALRMKEQFMMFGKEKLVIEGGDGEGWLPNNPFGVQSDWEQHVIGRGDPMYRLMLRKVR